VLAAVHVLALTGAPAAQPTQKLVFALNWFAVGDHARTGSRSTRVLQIARLDVELQNSKGSGDSIAKVDTNRADVGLADAVVVIPRVAQGARIKIVGAVFDNTPLNIWTRKDTGITRPKDLEGKILAAPPGDSQRQLFPAFAKVNGVDASKVTWLTIEPAAKFVALAEKRADAVPDTPRVSRLGEGRRQGQPRGHAVEQIRVRHLLDVDLHERQDVGRAAEGPARLPGRVVSGLA